MIVLRTPGVSGRSNKQSSFGYSSTAVEGYKRCSGYGGCSVFTSSTTGQYLNNRCGSKHLIANSHAGLIECKEDMYRLLPMTAGFFLSRFLVLVIRLNYFVKTGKCNYSSKLHKFKLLVLLWCWVIPLYDVLQQVIQVLIAGNILDFLYMHTGIRYSSPFASKTLCPSHSVEKVVS